MKTPANCEHISLFLIYSAKNSYISPFRVVKNPNLNHQKVIPPTLVSCSRMFSRDINPSTHPSINLFYRVFALMSALNLLSPVSAKWHL